MDWLEVFIKNFPVLNQLLDDKFTGSLTIHFYEGEVKAVEKKEKLKPSVCYRH